MIDIVSLGAGKQSSYMLLNALENRYERKPSLAIFSDTGCEPKYVYEYLNWLIKYVKDKYDFDIIIVSVGNLMTDVIDYLSGNKKRVAMLPLRLERDGMVMRQCTMDYKIAPLRKYIQQIRNKEKIRLWIGISLDERERQKNSPVQYIEHWYPLIENKIAIDEIINWYKMNNLPEPGKSACLICPFHSDNYWKTFKKQFPLEFQSACNFDDAIRNYKGLNKKAYLSKHLIPLKDIDFSQGLSLFPELIEDCEGLCGL
jgi:hypothetical protein